MCALAGALGVSPSPFGRRLGVWGGVTFRCRAVDRDARTGTSGGDIWAKKKPGLCGPAGEGVGCIR